MLPTMMESPRVAPFFNIWRPTDLNAIEGKLPVVVWANGGCARSDTSWRTMFESWASGGWFVLSLTSGGGSSSTTVRDQGAMIDWVVAQAGMAGGPYSGKLDVDRVVAAGNSCGGITSLGLAAVDDRVKSIFVLSGSSSAGGPDRNVVSKIKVPVAYVVGGNEDIARANAEADYEAFADGVPSMIINRSSGEHNFVSRDQAVIAHATEMSTNWLDLSIFGLPEALDALESPTVCTGCAAGLWTLKSKHLETLVD